MKRDHRTIEVGDLIQKISMGRKGINPSVYVDRGALGIVTALPTEINWSHYHVQFIDERGLRMPSLGIHYTEIKKVA
jgi:hypothetical protein